MRILSLLAAAMLLSAGAARAQSGATPPNDAAPPLGTGQGNGIVNPVGNAPSTVNASGTIRMMPMSDLAQGANSFTEGEARRRIAGAGFLDVSPLVLDSKGIWRGRAQKEGRMFDVGFDYKGQLAFQ